MYGKRRYISRGSTEVLVTLGFIGAMILYVIFAAHMEARTFNRLTDQDVTPWEALWVSLRVDCGDYNN